VNALLEIREKMLTDAAIKQEADKAFDTFKPDIGSEGADPMLLVIAVKNVDGIINHNQKPVYQRLLVPIITDDYNKFEDRAGFIRFAGQKIAEQKIQSVMVFLSSEAWMSCYKNSNHPIVMPSQDPERMEAFILAGMSIDKRMTMYMSHLSRNEKNKIDAVGDVKKTFATGKDQLFSDLLTEFWMGFMDTSKARIKLDG
jgi:hypothetical protein